MPRWPKREEGMEQPKRARRRKPETAKANLEPPLKELRRTGCPPRGGIRRVCGEVPGRSQWRLLQGRPNASPPDGRAHVCAAEERNGRLSARVSLCDDRSPPKCRSSLQKPRLPPP